MSVTSGGNTPPVVIRSGLTELITEINAVDQHEGVPLGTAEWMGLREATQRYGMRPDNLSERLWIGEAFNDDGTALGYGDDRHVTLWQARVAASRGLSFPPCANGSAPVSLLIPRVLMR